MRQLPGPATRVAATIMKEEGSARIINACMRVQGCCEHSLFFRDVRLIHAQDSHDPADYPALVYQVRLMPGA